MEKYGYKNISSRDEFEKASKKSTQIPNNPVDKKHLTNYNFIDITSNGTWGMPGQTRYSVKDTESLVNAHEKASKSIVKKRSPKGYVGW
jgi:hypothetical protein